MADQQAPPRAGSRSGGAAGSSGSSGAKILGMPRTTGLIVIGLGALVVGYVLVSHFMGNKGKGSGGGPAQGPSAGYGPGGPAQVRVIREWQGHGGRGRR